MNENTPTLPGLENIVKPFRFESQPYEYKVTPLRECPTPENLQMCDTPDKAAEYWQRHIATHPQFNPECECLVVLILNTRGRVKGHYLVTIGTMDTLLVHPREVFRLAITTSAAALVLMHNLCAAAHKLCYVERPFMCSHRLAALTLIRSSATARDGFTSTGGCGIHVNMGFTAKGCYV